MKKAILGVGIFLFFIIGGYFFIIYGTNIPQVIEKQKELENQSSYLEQLNSKYATVEDCEDVTANSLPEIRDRCKYLWQFVQP